jgi:hypothetical protein
MSLFDKERLSQKRCQTRPLDQSPEPAKAQRDEQGTGFSGLIQAARTISFVLIHI